MPSVRSSLSFFTAMFGRRAGKGLWYKKEANVTFRKFKHTPTRCKKVSKQGGSAGQYHGAAGAPSAGPGAVQQHNSIACCADSIESRIGRCASASCILAELEKVFRAYSKFSMKPPPSLLDALFTQFERTVPQAEPREVMLLMRNCARLNCPPPASLFLVLQERLPAILPFFTRADISITLWALATLSLRPSEATLKALAARFLPQASFLTERDVALFMWAMACLDFCPSPACIKVCCERAEAFGEEISAQAIGNIHWALACFDHFPPIVEKAQHDKGGKM